MMFAANRYVVFAASALRGKSRKAGTVSGAPPKNSGINKTGIPIGQVLLPGRDEGHNLESTSMAIKPGSNDLYIVTSNGNGGQGATIFHAKVFARALTLYSHR